MLYEWKLDGETRNLGDSLYEVLLPPMVKDDLMADQEHMYFPIGSVICNEVILECLAIGVKPVFMGCGWRGEPLDPELVQYCEFVGVRGPHTQAELARFGLEIPVVGDPAYELPKLFPAGKPNGLAIAIRHIKDDSDYNLDSVFELGADALFSPVVNDYDDIVETIQQISGARFVLAGSMHAAIIAHAYGVPFALMNSNYIDCPPKWFDWLASIEKGPPIFVNNVREGREWYSKNFRD